MIHLSHIQALLTMGAKGRYAIQGSALGGVIAVVSGLFALAIFLYIGSKVWKNFAKNEPIDIYPLLRPFVICILVSNFQGLVIRPLDGVISPIVSYITSKGRQGDNAAFEAVMKKVDQVRENRRLADEKSEAEAEKQGMLAKIGKIGENSFKEFFHRISEWLAEFIFIILDYVGFGLRVFFKFFIIFTQQFYLCMLALIGPIAFTISIFPGYSSTLTNWISKYVSILFWAPIIALADVFIGNILALLLDLFFRVADFTGDGLITNNGVFVHTAIVTLGALSLLLSLYSYFIYKKVPTIASWVIQGGDTGNASSLANILGTIAGAVGAIVGASYVGAAAKGTSGAQGTAGASGGGTTASSGTAASSTTQKAAVAAGNAANSQN